MSGRDSQIITYVSQEEKQQIKSWADETGKSVSQLARDAIMEYVDHDRSARIEEKVDRALTLLENEEHTHTRDMSTQSVPEKAREIARRVFRNHQTPVKGKDVEIAIEDIAGGDTRTIKKYKSQLKKRELLFAHPLQPVWTDSKEEFVSWVQGATVEADIYEITEDYGMDTEEYHEIAEATE